MNKLRTYLPIVISVLVSLVVFISLNTIKKDNYSPKEVYNVYLDGKLLGAVNSKASLEKYIDKEQKELKEDYDVDKIYIPNGIDIEKCITSAEKVSSEKEIYEKIKSEKSFTIKGYVVTITDSEGNEKKINILKKNLFDKATKKVLKVFTDAKQLEDYKSGNTTEIKTTGSMIENIYIDEAITIKESFISTDELIFTDVTTLTKYLLFGSLDKDEEYIVKPGDTIETVAFNNKLGVEEFLIVNPEFTSSNNLLSVGQTVSIALIDPIFSIVVEKHVVEDMDKPYDTIEKNDSNLYYGQTKVETEGVNGVQRVTSKVKYVNGEAQPAYITDTKVITEPTNKVVLKGTKSYGSNYSGGGTPAVVSGDWGWPTISPYIITSYYGYRWGRLHAGIDISGCGFGSPIYSIGEGTVSSVTGGCADRGYYGSSCGGGYGNAVRVIYSGGMEVIYSHIMGSNIRVSVGDHVSKGQVVGYMGNSGSSTGTHLHFQININGSSVNPLTLYK